MKYWGSEVCYGYVLGFCYGNSGSSSSSCWCIMVVQETGVQHNVPLMSVSSLERNIWVHKCDGYALGFCYGISGISGSINVCCTVIVQKIGA